MRCKKAISLRSGIKYIIFVLSVILITLTVLPKGEVYAASQTVKVGIPVEERPELFVSRTMPTHGEGKIAVFLIDFPDYPNDNPYATREFYEDLYFNGADTSWGQNYSVSKFYKDQSYGKLNLSGEVFDWYTAKHERSYYDDKKAELVMEAAEYYASQGVDFSEFDGDGDGVVDAITYHFAGHSSEADQSDPWYHGFYYSSSLAYGQIDGVSFKSYIQLYENAEATHASLIHTICHELLHSLGMFDLYSGVRLEVDGSSDLMGATNAMTINPYYKLLLGWIDEVKVITEPSKGIRLNEYESTGDFAIVTDEFNGFFDEFYIVAYRKYFQFTTAVVWQIDARIGDNGQFISSNVSYDPRPDLSDSQIGLSPHLLIEELSSDPTADYILNAPFSPEVTGFDADSVIGPNSLPSSDFHGEGFTGIRMENFAPHNDTYLTFDLSFVTDSSAPVPTTPANELKLDKTVKISFNEYIYSDKGAPSIYVTDLEGNRLDASVILPNYPNHQIEITFNTDAYKNGYKVVFPAGSLRDSAGNAVAQTVLTASKEGFLFPVTSVKLPSADGLDRLGGLFQGGFFPDDEGITVILPLWGEHGGGEHFEYMRLDLEGNVLSQKILRQPFGPVSGMVSEIVKAPDGSFIVFYRKTSDQWFSNVLCIDKNGDLRWVRSDYGEQRNFEGYSALPYGNGISVRLDTRYPDYVVEYVYLDPKTGDVTPISGWENIYSDYFMGSFPNGDRLLKFIESKNGKTVTRLKIVDCNTFALKAEASFDGEWLNGQLYAYSDGTFFFQYIKDGYSYVTIFDDLLNEIKTARLSKQNPSGNELNFIGEDGFCEMIRDEMISHSENPYHVTRYDRYLNKLWETDLKANFALFFKSPSGEVLAYRSSETPEIACYIDSYGSEDAFKTVHVHTLVRRAAVSATCKSEGTKEHWYCSGCGGLFLDKNGASAANAEALRLPLSDTHNFGSWVTTRYPTASSEGSESRTCKDCGLSESRSIPKLPSTSATTSQPQTTVPQTTVPQTTVPQTTPPPQTTTAEPPSPPATLPPSLPSTVVIMLEAVIHGANIVLDAVTKR